MPNYVVKIALLDMPLSQAKSITGGIYELIDDSDFFEGPVMIYLTEGEISDEDIEQDEELDRQDGEDYRAGINPNPLPDDFPVID